LAAHGSLAGAVTAASAGGTGPQSALDDFDRLFFNTLVLALDRLYVHRLRGVTGKDSNALNEVELIVESLMNNDGVFRGNNVIKYAPEQSQVGLKAGDRIRLTGAQFERLSAAFFAELESKFLEA
jgi:hypothetical protein